MKLINGVFLILLLTACKYSIPESECKIKSGTADLSSANAGCLISNKDKLLVIRHRANGKLGLPGGSSEYGETAQCTAHRETWEETGLDTIVGEKLYTFENSYQLYACYPEPAEQLDAEKLITNDAFEVSDVLWRDPKTLKRKKWRFPKQLRKLKELFYALTTAKTQIN